jgi:hypothetical protein
MSIVRRLWSLLLPRQRQAAFLLFAAVLVATVLETVSIGLVVPALAFLTRDMSATSPHMTSWFTWLGNPARNRLTLLMLVGILTVYAVRAVFLLCVEYWHATFTWAIQANTSRWAPWSLPACSALQPGCFRRSHVRTRCAGTMPDGITRGW